MVNHRRYFRVIHLAFRKDRLNEAVEYYESGARGIAGRDAGYNGFDMHEWFILSRMGHIDETKVREQLELPEKNLKIFFKIWFNFFFVRFIHQ